MTFLTVVMDTAESAQPLTLTGTWSLRSTYGAPNVNSILMEKERPPPGPAWTACSSSKLSSSTRPGAVSGPDDPVQSTC